MSRRLRYHIASRLNRWRSQRDYRWTQATFGKKQRVIIRNKCGNERVLDLRAGSSDFCVFVEVFDSRQYDSSRFTRHADIVARYNAILAGNRRPLIIDAGANIGMTSLWFREQYPEALIVAIEPEESNFRELSKHIGGDILTQPMFAALSPTAGRVKVVDPGWREFGFRTEPSDDQGAVPAYTLDQIMASNDADPFILKVDIEGFEKDLFGDPPTIDRFYAVFIELHDWLLPKQRTSASFLQAVASLDRDFVTLGNNLLSISNREP